MNKNNDDQKIILLSDEEFGDFYFTDIAEEDDIQFFSVPNVGPNLRC
jgi:hypothetical protein